MKINYILCVTQPIMTHNDPDSKTHGTNPTYPFEPQAPLRLQSMQHVHRNSVHDAAGRK
jgi:hypothetical protein